MADLQHSHHWLLPSLPVRTPESHKGSFGRVLIVGGSRGMSGAAALAGVAALRSGAGLVQVATAQSCVPLVAAYEPSYLTAELPEDRDGRIAYAALPSITRLAQSATAVAIGPGLGQSLGLQLLVSQLYRELAAPLVLDADALNVLAPIRPRLPADVACRAVRILTPHPGEFARLADLRTEQVQSDRLGHARQLAAATQAVILLKGHATVITNAEHSFINSTGNPGMATGGTGDVLTGIIVGLLAQGLAALDAARLGAYVHGLSGDLAAAARGQVALIASDLLHFLPAALRQVDGDAHPN